MGVQLKLWAWVFIAQENAPKFPSSSSLLTLLKINVSYLELFINHFITAIENIRFEIYFRFISIQTYRIFYFSRRFMVSDFH